MKTDIHNPGLKIFKELLCGECRHQIVFRKRDNSYWYVRHVRASHGWRPSQVENQSGTFQAAEKKFYEQTT